MVDGLRETLLIAPLQERLLSRLADGTSSVAESLHRDSSKPFVKLVREIDL